MQALDLLVFKALARAESINLPISYSFPFIFYIFKCLFPFL